MMAKDLTPEELAKAEELPLDELRRLAMHGDDEVKTVEVSADGNAKDKTAKTQPRTSDGKFSALDVDTDEIVVEGTDAAEQEDEDDEPEEKTKLRKVIENEDGTVDVYTADSYEELVDKIAEGKRQAVAQMRRVQKEKQELESKNTQVDKDEQFRLSNEMKTNPVKAAEEIARRTYREEAAKATRSQQAQSDFVTSHPDYIADPKNGNGNRLVAEYLRLHPQADEFTPEGLEKAYLNLKRDGLLTLRAEEAGDAPDDKASDIQRTVEPEADATAQRKQKKGSNISTRSGGRTTPKVGAELSEAELYSMPLEKLKELANKQMAS